MSTIITSSWNTTPTPMTNTVDSGAMLALVVILALCMLGMLLIYNVKSWGWFGKFVGTLKFTAYGGGISAAVYGLYIACGALASAGRGADPIWIAYAIVGYIVLTMLGWLGNKVATRITNSYKEYKSTAPTEASL